MMKQALSSPLLAALHLATASTPRTNAVGVTLICLAVVVVLVLVVLLFNEFHARRRLPSAAQPEKNVAKGLPAGKIVYQDADGTGAPLLATSHALSGKPDYVILAPDGKPIPVELKLSVKEEEPQRHHIMQLAAYFVILEDLYDQPPAYGVLRYANKDFKIEYTEALKRKVLRRLGEMERCDEQHPPVLTHQVAGKCHTCPFQPICPIGLRQVTR